VDGEAGALLTEILGTSGGFEKAHSLAAKGLAANP